MSKILIPPLRKPSVDKHNRKPINVRPIYKTVQLTHYELPVCDNGKPAWLDVLQKAKYPEPVLVLDFETYFDGEYDLKKQSTVEYIYDKRFEILGLACFCKGNWTEYESYEQDTHWYNGETTVARELEYLQSIFGYNLERCTIVIHNAKFDGAILSFRFDIHPPYVVDTLGLANHWNSRTKNGLDDLTKRFKLPGKGDTKKFKGWTNKRRLKKPKTKKKGPVLPVQVERMTEEQAQELGDYAINDVKREWELFTILLPRLSCPHTELRAIQHTLDLFWQPRIEVDEQMAKSLIEQMEQEIDKPILKLNENSQVDLVRSDLSGLDSFEEILGQALVEAGDDPQRYMKLTKRANKRYKFAIAQEDPEREKLINHPDSFVRELMEAKLAIQSWPLHIARVQRIVNQSKPLGKLPVPLKYCGAHTGRWSGGEKINLQNLGTRGNPLISRVRELLIAPKYSRFVITDAAQIEARVVAWVADQADLVQAFKDGRDVYCEFASVVLGEEIRKPTESDSEEKIKRLKWARNRIGKIGILGCGYGMGVDRAMEQAEGELDYTTAESLIETYRSKNNKIRDFWYEIERIFIYVYRYKKDVTLYPGLTIRSDKDCDVIIVLPNGRELKYIDIKVDQTTCGETIKEYNPLRKVWNYIWGGHLTENIVQAISRDILWESIWILEEMGWPVVHHVHDEIIACVPEDKAQGCLNASIEALSTVPEWGKGLPLAAEGIITDRYGGH